MRHPNPQVQRAIKALRDSGDLKLLLTELEKEYIEMIAGSAHSDVEIREAAYSKIALGRDLLTLVENYE